MRLPPVWTLVVMTRLSVAAVFVKMIAVEMATIVMAVMKVGLAVKMFHSMSGALERDASLQTPHEPA